MVSSFDSLYTDMLYSFESMSTQVALGLGLATPTPEDGPEPRQPASSDSIPTASTSFRSVGSIPTHLVQMRADGNCQYRAVSYLLWNEQERHDEVRQAAVRQLKACSERYSAHVSGSYRQYLEQMAQPGFWGDHVSLQATADAYAVRINVVQRQAPTEPTSIEPNLVPKGRRIRGELWLDFEPEVHYNALVADPDPQQSPPGSPGPSISQRTSPRSPPREPSGWGLNFGLWSPPPTTKHAPVAALPWSALHAASAAAPPPPPPRAASRAVPQVPARFEHTDQAYLHPVTTGRYDRSSDEDHHQDAPQSKASAWRARLERKQKHLAAKVFSRVHASTHRREEAPGSPPDRPEL